MRTPRGARSDAVIGRAAAGMEASMTLGAFPAR